MSFFMYQHVHPGTKKLDDGKYVDLVIYDFEFSDGQKIWKTQYTQEIVEGLITESTAFLEFKNVEEMTCTFQNWKRSKSWKPPTRRKVDNQDQPLT